MDSIIVFCAKYLVVVIALLTAWVWFKLADAQKSRLVLTIVMGGIVALILSRLASKLYFDPRPFATRHIKPLISHSADNGFPSDHTLLAMTLTAAVYYSNKKIAAILLVLTLVVGISRILAHVHSPIDIIGSIAIATAATAIAHFLIVRYRRKGLAPGSQKSAVDQKDN